MMVQTREQAIVAAFAQETSLAWGKLESRAESLPSMIMRHGVLPVKLFLEAKQGSDQELWQMVERAVQRVLPGVPFGLDALATMSFETYLLVNDVATEAAALIARWVKVQTAHAQRSATSPGEAQKGAAP